MLSANEQGRAVIGTKVIVGRFKGALRSHDEAAGLGVIDTRIRGLVEAFNVQGVVSSVSSCEGHRLWCLPTRRTPFVMFCTDVARAARLADRILLDYGQGCELHHYWRIDATFNADGGLVFSLHCPDQRFNRRKLDADILRLTQWVRDVFQNQPAEHARSLD
ncbi:hypothetical protein [Achromobacter sp. MYb9]|uniref:hypothetical protein n=1 Tax=Achromobacter sp. MYb9 TaxID=1827284 RepID=UPI000CFC40FD|nr:hypothetical protein [Achromobacter sp. MYb9]